MFIGLFLFVATIISWWLQPVPMIFTALPFHGIPWRSEVDHCHTLFSFSSPNSQLPSNPTYPHFFHWKPPHSFRGFPRVCHPRPRSTDFSCSLSSSFVFHCLCRRHSSSTNRTLFSNQSSFPLVPFPGNRRPRQFKQQFLGCFKIVSLPQDSRE